MKLDPLNLGVAEGPEEKQQPKVTNDDGTPRLPRFVDNQELSGWFGQGFARPTPGSTTIRRVIVTAGGKHENNGAAFVYVAAGGSRLVHIFGAVDLEDLGSFGPGGCAGSSAQKWDSLQSIAYWRGEVFVLGMLSGKQQICVFGEDGTFRRTLAALPSFLGPFEGMDAAFGELWLTSSPPRDGTADLLGQQAVMLDTQTGALKGLGLQPLGDMDAADPARSWWDISIAPELQAGIVDRRLFQRGLLLPGLLSIGSPLCLGQLYYGCASTNQRGTDAVPGMRWFLELPSYADMGTNRPVREYSIDTRSTTIDASLLTQLLGKPISLEHPGYYLTPKRTWETKQQVAGDTITVSDLTYNSRDVRIDWWGKLKRSDWVRGQKCVGYIVSEADIYVVGDRGERWYELAQDFEKIELLVDGEVVDSSLEATSLDPLGNDSYSKPELCIDTAELTPDNEPRFPDDVHSLELRATIKPPDVEPGGEQIVTAHNPELSIDNTIPDQTFEDLPTFVRQTVPLRGTTVDSPAGLRDWQAELRPTTRTEAKPAPGATWQGLPDYRDDQTGVVRPCSDLEPDRFGQVTIDCTWDTYGHFPDGWYWAQLGSRDWASDDPPVNPPNVDPQIFGTETPDDDGNRAPAPEDETNPQRVFVDNTPPTIDVYGDLVQYASAGAMLNTAVYPLTFVAHDGGSGALSVDIRVDGISQQQFSRSCEFGGCDLGGSYNFVGGKYSQGNHVLEIVIRDQVGWTSTIAWPFHLDYVLPGDGYGGGAGASASTSATQGISIAKQSPQELEAAEVEAGALLPCTESDEPSNFTTYSVGPEFDSGGSEFGTLPLTAVDRLCEAPEPNEVASLVPGSYLRANNVSYIYGDCQAGVGAETPDCEPPLEIQTWPICERNASSYPLPDWAGLPAQLPRVPTELRDVPAALFDEVMRVGEDASSVLSEGELDDAGGLRIELYTGDSTIIVFATDANLARSAVDALRAEPISEPPSTPPVDVPDDLDDPLTTPLPGAMKGALQCTGPVLEQVTSTAGQSAPAPSVESSLTAPTPTGGL